MAVLWLINGGDPNYLLTGMILQVLYMVQKEKTGFKVKSTVAMHWMLTLAIYMLSKCSARCQSLMYICMV